MKAEITLRPAVLEDSEGMLAIFRPYVESTAISFEWETPSLKTFQAKIKKLLPKYPCLVAEKNGEIVGYAYTAPYIVRTAYDWTAEVTIYIRADQCGQGLGRRLCTALERISELQGIHRLYVCIAVPEIEDEYLTFNSADFHEHIGYRRIGTFAACGYKFGNWYDMIWMEKVLKEPGPAKAPIPFAEIPFEEVQTLLSSI